MIEIKSICTKPLWYFVNYAILKSQQFKLIKTVVVI